MYDRSAWFLRVIKSNLFVVLLALSEEAKTKRSMYNKTIVRFDFSDIQNNQGLSKGYQSKAWADIPTSILIILDITKISSNN